MHCATQDHYGLGDRKGWRTISIAETPFLDANSPSRKEAQRAADKVKNGSGKY